MLASSERRAVSHRGRQIGEIAVLRTRMRCDAEFAQAIRDVLGEVCRMHGVDVTPTTIDELVPALPGELERTRVHVIL